MTFKDKKLTDDARLDHENASTREDYILYKICHKDKREKLNDESWKRGMRREEAFLMEYQSVGHTSMHVADN